MALSTAGELVKKGTYKCIHCGHYVTVYDDHETLPPCPKCRETDYFQLS